MEIALRSGSPLSARADLLVVSAASAADPTIRAIDRRVKGHFGRFLRRRGLKSGNGSALLYQTPPGGFGAESVLVVPRLDNPMRTARALAEAAITRARELRARTLAIALEDAEMVEPLAETLDLAAYQFRGLKSGKSPRSPWATHVAVFGARGKSASAALARGAAFARAACLARDLVNLPADIVTPTHLGEVARRLGRENRLAVRVLGPKQIRHLGMGALLGVARGSDQPPRFIEIVYRPRRPSRRIALVGKGITFDSGGLSLKSGESMQSQKKDMAGGAVVLGVMSAVRVLGVKAEVRGYIAATENMPSGKAIKPGDVVRALNGKTIEVLNTDAEGRLVLADALSHAALAKPDAMIDFATLTAAVRTTLGPRYAALMASDDALARALLRASAEEAECLWQLPLVDDYRRDLDSSVADLKNTGEGHSGTIIGGLFLREFTAGLPWAHIDFSSTAVTERPYAGHPRGASGFGVRTTLRYLLAL